MKDKQFIVIGLGIFGETVAQRLSELGHEVMALDDNLKSVEKISDKVTKAICVDTKDKDALEDLGVGDFDCAIVAIGTDLESEILTVLNLKELGVKEIYAKAKNEQAANVLLKVGADHVVRPEKERGLALANHILSKELIKTHDFNDYYSIIEIEAPVTWIGKNLKTLNLRQTYQMNIIGIQLANQNEMNMYVDPDRIIQEGDCFMAFVKKDLVPRFRSLIK